MIGKIRRSEWNSADRIKNYEWMLFKKKRIKRLDNSDFSIIASNCVRTIMYHDLGVPFLSPTINLSIGMDDFIRFARNPRPYLEEEIVEIKDGNDCPAGMAGDIRINFVHYDTFEEGVRKWQERKKRINWDNLFVIGMERDGCTYDTIQCFDELPYENKIILTHVRYQEFSSAYYIGGFEENGELGNVLDFKKQFLRRRYLDDLDYVTFLNSGVKKPAKKP